MEIRILKSCFRVSDGGRSSTVEPQIVVLVVAGSSPVGHPALGLQFAICDSGGSRTFRCGKSLVRIASRLISTGLQAGDLGI